MTASRFQIPSPNDPESYTYSSTSVNPFDIGDVGINTPAPAGSTISTANYGGLPQSVWDPNAGRVSSTTIIGLFNVQDKLVSSGTASALLAQFQAISSYFSAQYYPQGEVVLPGGGAFAFYAAQDYSQQGLAGFLERSAVPSVVMTPPGAPATPSLSLTDVNSLYMAVLNRPIPQDNATLNYAENDPNLRSDLANSAEAQADIANAFQNILNRPISAGYQAAITNNLALSYESMAGYYNSLAYSAEAQGDAAAIYQNILDRPIDPGSLANIQAGLAGGQVTMAGLQTAVAYSTEASNVANQAYVNILNRPVDPGGLAFYQTNAASGAVTIGSFESLLAYSAEAQNDIETFSQNILGHTIDPSFFESILATGSSQAMVISDMAYSTETAKDVVAIYQSMLDRTPGADVVGGA